MENLQNLEKRLKEQRLKEQRLKEHLGEIFSEQTSLTQDAHATAIAAVVGPTAEKRRALAQKKRTPASLDLQSRSSAEGGSSVGLQAKGGSQGEHHRPGRLAYAG